MKKIGLSVALLLAFYSAPSIAADTVTTNLGLVKPSIGSTSWGTKINNDFGIIDSSVAIKNLGNAFTGTNSFTSISGMTVTSGTFTTLYASSGSVSNFYATTGTINSFMVVGTQSNDDAPSGRIGQRISSTTASTTNFPASGTYGDLLAITLTAGNWDIDFVINQQINGATVTELDYFIGAVAGNNQTGQLAGDNSLTWTLTIANNTATIPFSLSGFQVKLLGTTTYYLKYSSVYTVAIPKAGARISARRMF